MAAAGLPRVPLDPGTLFIGDLHLEPDDERGVQTFAAFLDRHRGAPRVVVLGDLFEFWFGPAQARLGAAHRVLEDLRRCVEAGTAVDLVPGNRDFLLGEEFEGATGARLRPRGFLGELPGGQRLLALHGDELCTRDRGYQRLRRVLRSGPVRWLAPRLPGALALAVARSLRGASSRAVARKPAPEKAMQPAAVTGLAREHAADALVCGHAHRFRDEALADGPRWLVVDAFGGARDTLVVGSDGDLRVHE